jgi:hypothetical protein
MDNFADGDRDRPGFAFIGTVTDRSKPIEGLGGYARRLTFDVKAVLHGADRRTQRVLVPSNPPKFPPGEGQVAVPGRGFGKSYRGGGLQLVSGFRDRDGTRDASAACSDFGGEISVERARRFVELADHATVYNERFRPPPDHPPPPTLPETGVGLLPALLLGALVTAAGAGLTRLARGAR